MLSVNLQCSGCDIQNSVDHNGNADQVQQRQNSECISDRESHSAIQDCTGKIDESTNSPHLSARSIATRPEHRTNGPYAIIRRRNPASVNLDHSSDRSCPPARIITPTLNGVGRAENSFGTMFVMRRPQFPISAFHSPNQVCAPKGFMSKRCTEDSPSSSAGQLTRARVSPSGNIETH